MSLGPPRSRSSILGIYVSVSPGYDVRVGSLIRGHTGGTTFQVDEDFVALGPNRPVLSLGWTSPDEADTKRRLRDPSGKFRSGDGLPAFFDNLLPEGMLRELVERDMGATRFDGFDVLARLGGDLPGAVVAKLEAASETDLNSLASAEGNRTVGPSNYPAIRFSLAGVQLKFSMRVERSKLTVPARLGDGNVILKTPTSKYPLLPEAEYSGLRLAEEVGIEVAHAYLVSNDEIQGIPSEFLIDGHQSLAIDRFDRTAERRVHIEDFAQVLGINSSQKYSSNEVTVMNVVHRFSSDKMGGLLEATRRITANILLGNCDAHLKNWSFRIEGPECVKLSPAYDIVPTIIYGFNKMALKLGGSDDPTIARLHRFERAAGAMRVNPKVITDEVRRTVERAFEVWPTMMSELPLTNEHRAVLESHMASIELVKEISPKWVAGWTPDAPATPSP